MAERERADAYLVRKGFFRSRHRAQAAILEGKVFVGGERVEKPGETVRHGDQVRVVPEPEFVSRGGLKLKKALEAFAVNPSGQVAMDAGAGTGGFTDCLLEEGASGVLAVDVGYGELSFKLRRDPRVLVMERTNVRYLEPDDVPVRPELIVSDLSFISQTKAAPAFGRLLAPGGRIIILVKPQFEAGRELVGKKGVVRDPAVQTQVLNRVIEGFREAGLHCGGVTFSPIKGRQGNIEFLVLFSDRDVGLKDWGEEIKRAVAAAHQELE